MMKVNYSRFSFEERIQVEKLLSHNKSYSEIARVLHRHKSTIQREVSRIQKRKYSCMQANWDVVLTTYN